MNDDCCDDVPNDGSNGGSLNGNDGKNCGEKNYGVRNCGGKSCDDGGTIYVVNVPMNGVCSHRFYIYLNYFVSSSEINTPFTRYLYAG